MTESLFLDSTYRWSNKHLALLVDGSWIDRDRKIDENHSKTSKNYQFRGKDRESLFVHCFIAIHIEYSDDLLIGISHCNREWNCQNSKATNI